MRGREYVGFDVECRELRVEVLSRPWRLRFVRPVGEALAEVADVARDVQDSAGTPQPSSVDAQDGRRTGLAAAAVLLAVVAAVCVLPAVVELVVLLVVWPLWLVALRVPGVPRTVEVRQGQHVVHSVRARDRAHADELGAQLRRRLDAGEPLEPEPTDFSDLLVRTR